MNLMKIIRMIHKENLRNLMIREIMISSDVFHPRHATLLFHINILYWNPVSTNPENPALFDVNLLCTLLNKVFLIQQVYFIHILLKVYLSKYSKISCECSFYLFLNFLFLVDCVMSLRYFPRPFATHRDRVTCCVW